MSIVQYQREQWQEHQSNMTKFINLLDKNKNNIKNTDLYVMKLLELNTLLNQVENIIDDIKYECVYPNTKYKNKSKINDEIKEHLRQKQIIKNLIQYV